MAIIFWKTIYPWSKYMWPIYMITNWIFCYMTIFEGTPKMHQISPGTDTVFKFSKNEEIFLQDTWNFFYSFRNSNNSRFYRKNCLLCNISVMRDVIWCFNREFSDCNGYDVSVYTCATLICSLLCYIYQIIFLSIAWHRHKSETKY